jgi:hypothetical protein
MKHKALKRKEFVTIEETQQLPEGVCYEWNSYTYS